MGNDGSNNGATDGPRMFASDWKPIAADSRSYPDFLLVANEWRPFKTPESLFRNLN